MRSYWDDRADVNAFWYVDTSLSFENPDTDQFFASGRRIAEQALEGTQLPGTQLAVEIGSGLGRIAVALSERFERVVGVDISPEMVQRARDLVRRPGVTFEVGDGGSLAAIADGAADLVMSFTVFQHIPRTSVIEQYIAEAGRVLRPGGVFVFQWNNSPGPVRWAMRRTLLSFLQRTGLRAERHGRNAAQFLGSCVSLPRITRALDRSGFELRRTEGLGTLFAWAWAYRKG